MQNRRAADAADAAVSAPSCKLTRSAVFALQPPSRAATAAGTATPQAGKSQTPPLTRTAAARWFPTDAGGLSPAAHCENPGTQTEDRRPSCESRRRRSHRRSHLPAMSEGSAALAPCLHVCSCAGMSMHEWHLVSAGAQRAKISCSTAVGRSSNVTDGSGSLWVSMFEPD